MASSAGKKDVESDFREQFAQDFRSGLARHVAPVGGRYASALGSVAELATVAGGAAAVYTWNRSRPVDVRTGWRLAEAALGLLVVGSGGFGNGGLSTSVGRIGAALVIGSLFDLIAPNPAPTGAPIAYTAVSPATVQAVLPRH